MLTGLLAGCGGGEESSSSTSASTSTTSRPSSSSSSSGSSSEAKGEIETGEVTPPSEDILKKIEDLKAENSDTVGWLIADGADCDLGVLQTTDNQFYHRRGYDKEYAWLGALFLDYEVTGGSGTREDISRNFIVYGHNVDDDRENGEMFAKLINYDDPEYAAEHPYIWYYTEEDSMLFYVFAAFLSEATDWYIYPNQTDEEFQAVIDEALDRSQILTDDIDVTVDDKIITLATCTNQNDKNWQERWVVMGRLAREGEDHEMEIEYTLNPDPKPSAA